jgi:hypothetical protein
VCPVKTTADCYSVYVLIDPHHNQVDRIVAIVL